MLGTNTKSNRYKIMYSHKQRNIEKDDSKSLITNLQVSNVYSFNL